MVEIMFNDAVVLVKNCAIFMNGSAKTSTMPEIAIEYSNVLQLRAFLQSKNKFLKLKRIV